MYIALLQACWYFCSLFALYDWRHSSSKV